MMTKNYRWENRNRTAIVIVVKKNAILSTTVKEYMVRVSI